MSKVIGNALCLGSTVLSIVLVLANSSLGADFSTSRTTANAGATDKEYHTPYLEKSNQYIRNTLTEEGAGSRELRAGKSKTYSARNSPSVPRGRQLAPTQKWIHANVFIHGKDRKICAEIACNEAQNGHIQAPTFRYRVPLLPAPSALLPPLTQVTPVSQLSDIKKTDWSFQALKSLIERYGLFADNFDNTLRGNQSMARYEFAALLNAAINRLNELIAKENADLVRKEDLAIIQRLQSEFTTELAILQRRVDNLEVNTSQLAAQQFSTTAKLSGEVIFAISGANGDEQADDNDEEVDESLILSDRVWLTFDMSFTGRDRLFVRLEAENTPGFDDATGTEMARLGFEGDSDNELDVNELEFSFPVNEQGNLYITNDSSDIQRVANTTSSFSSSGSGAISRFGRYSPLYRQDFGAAVRLKYEFSDAASLSVGYGDDDADDEDDGEFSLNGETDGAFFQLILQPIDGIELGLAYLRSDDNYGAIVKLILEPIEDIELGLTYLRSYNNLDTGTGSELANEPFDDESNNVTTNSYGLEANIEVSSGFTIGGWVSLTEAKAQDLSGNPEATILHYAVTLAFPDLGKEDSLAGVVIGQPPKVTGNDFGIEYTDKDTSLHLEFFYRFQATDNIAITPGLLVITNPEHDKNNDTICVGTVRTTFSF